MKESGTLYQEKPENLTLRLLSCIDRAVLNDRYFAERESISSEYRFRTADRFAMVSESGTPTKYVFLSVSHIRSYAPDQLRPLSNQRFVVIRLLRDNSNIIVLPSPLSTCNITTFSLDPHACSNCSIVMFKELNIYIWA